MTLDTLSQTSEYLPVLNQLNDYQKEIDLYRSQDGYEAEKTLQLVKAIADEAALASIKTFVIDTLQSTINHKKAELANVIKDL